MLDHLTKSQKSLYYALLLNFITIGISVTIFGATLPQIIDGFHWNTLIVGFLMAVSALGSFLASVACGHLMQRFSNKLLLVIGLSILSGSLILFGKWPAIAINTLMLFLLGAGTGIAEVITNTVVVRMEKPGESRLMNFMHAGFCIGAACGPFAIGILTKISVSFSSFFSGAGVMVFGICILVLLQTFAQPSATNSGSDSKSNDDGKLPWHHPLFWALIIAMFLYVGVELTYNGWIAEFAARYRDFTNSQAAWMVSLFWIGLLAGRLLLSFVIKPRRQNLTLALLASASVVFYTATVFLTSPSALGPLYTWACVFLTGLFFSGCYPIIVSILGEEYQGNSTAIGICTSAASLGALIFPFATGAIASAISLPTTILMIAGVDAGLAMTAILITLSRRYRPNR
ncbi:MAG: MFS transporter [Deltaproteobacteria bacterium]|nr:MFS transporter [Deltaproteobacteria bacterium]